MSLLFSIFLLLPVVIPLLVGVLLVLASWRVYAKAGQPGWGVLVPFYNLYLWCKIAGKPGWWVFLFFVPFLNLVVVLLLSLGVAKAFGKSESFGVLLALLAPIAVPVLAFTDVTYTPPSGSSAPLPAEPSKLITEQRSQGAL